MSLLEQIEKLREKLNQAANPQGCLTHEEVLKLSQELDRLILQYVKSRKHPEKPD
ncbi:Sporulation stage 0, Spo0E-like regulatory phosphatase [Caldalkalibacillus thermarum TA2.A1]|uniref:Aspartyl-phosphate phosphatase Spo0E family protein n=1 Tax=Caldalkalibacillus thermarum (strain TA2.A1) TaxID=986075 RepID=F5L476_CALTT|nr:aspartyl-phosphate phosphatase Spo0E family protein [Caldalkalibacillus thermarum]EGL83864.1 Sporulation stage 0, Spo0E-like regulatory phosphatase [Caldalkalibacillus thermarum TA2.A1]QZT34217.1 aspartyl-phosphate phosphatase Spo0E family protein [Caldalkalibacillus thermarum TA2.A1]